MSKQSDPVYSLAEQIVNTSRRIASSNVKKANYDQSYPSSIMSVNQKFVSDISQEDTDAIITQFNIPETVGDNDPKYYTFRINGVTYCKKQNGNFKLYDNIMVYIPNGDWSRMYFDHALGIEDAFSAGNNSDVELPNVIVSVDKPGGDDNEGGDIWVVVNDEEITEFENIASDSFVRIYEYKEDDNGIVQWVYTKCLISKEIPSGSDISEGIYWLQVNNDGEAVKLNKCTAIDETSAIWNEVYPNSEVSYAPSLLISVEYPMKDGDYWIDIDNESDTNIEGLYRYEYDKVENCMVWKVLGYASSGGVGEWLDDEHTIERFNDYTPYTVDLEELTHSGGNYSNGKYDHIEGKGNASLVSQNTDLPKANHIGGQDNTFYDCERTSCPSGQGNVAKQLNDSIIFGRYIRKLYDSSSYGCLLGGLNVILNGYIHACLVLGEYFSLNQVRKSAVFGEYLTMLGEIFDSVICGAYHQQSSNGDIIYRSIAAGQSINLTRVFDSLLCGARNNIIYSNSSMICGEQHQCSMATDAVVCGIGAQVNQSAQVIVAGNGTQNSPRNVFEVNSQGYVTATAYNTSGADYTEYFEWSDGNPNNENRIGMLVSCDGDKIYLANDDDIIGAVSGKPSIIGNAAELYWHNKYETNIYGELILDENGKPVLSPDYDSSKEYKPRSQRPEWATIGLTGRLVVNDDSTCIVNKYCTASNGVATFSKHKTNVRVLKRIDESHIEVLIK